MQVGYRSAREMAEEFGIAVDSVRRWVRQADRGEGRRKDGLTTAERKELAGQCRSHRASVN